MSLKSTFNTIAETGYKVAMGAAVAIPFAAVTGLAAGTDLKSLFFATAIAGFDGVASATILAGVGATAGAAVGFLVGYSHGSTKLEEKKADRERDKRDPIRAKIASFTSG